MACCARACSAAASAATAAASSRAARPRRAARAALFEREALGLAPRFERRALDLELGAARLQHLGLLRIERNLLLAPIDLELAGMRRFAHARRRRFGFGQLDAQPPELVLDFGEPRRGAPLRCSRASASRARADSMTSPSER